MTIPRWVYPGDLLQNPVGFQCCNLDTCPVCADGKRRLWRRRFQKVISDGQKAGLEILFISPKVYPGYFPSLREAYRFNAKVWELFYKGGGFWESAVKDWCRGRHVEHGWARGTSVWNVHDHIVLVLRGDRSKCMSSLSRVEKRIRKRWLNAVKGAAEHFGIRIPQAMVDIRPVGQTRQDAASLAKYLTRAPLRPPRRKMEESWAPANFKRSSYRCFSDLPAPLAEEFLLGTVRHQWNSMSDAAKRRTKNFSRKERIPDPKLRTGAKRLTWAEFRLSVHACALGRASQSERQTALEALPYVVASLLVQGLDNHARSLIDDWVQIIG